MNRQTSSAARLASTLVIVGIVAVACGRSNAAQGTQPATQGPTAAASALAETPTPTPVAATSDAPASPAASGSATPASATPAATYSPPAIANDPVTGEIQSIDQLLKGIDGSLSGADSGTNGGE